MIILSLDPATSTGYCLVAINDGKAHIYDYGFLDVDCSSEYQGDHCIDLMNKVESLVMIHGVDVITIEDYFFSKRFATGSTVNVAYRTAIHILCRRLEIPYVILNINLWKKFVAGRSSPTKQQKQQWGVSAKKMYIQDSLYKKWGFTFPEHSLSKKTGKPIKFRMDIVDAVGQTVYYCCSILRIKDISIKLV